MTTRAGLIGLIATAVTLAVIVRIAEPKTEEITVVQTLQPVKMELVIEEPAVAAQEPQEEALESLGEYFITAYCSCSKCCGEWASKRPVDDQGRPIVYTANGSIATQGITIAADTSELPFGTQVEIDGHTYTVQDVGGAIKGHRIDVYFNDHQAALAFGVKRLEIFKK